MRRVDRELLRAAIDRAQRARMEADTAIYFCAWCGERFTPKVSYQRYCDKACANLARQAQKNPAK